MYQKIVSEECISASISTLIGFVRSRLNIPIMDFPSTMYLPDLRSTSPSLLIKIGESYVGDNIFSNYFKIEIDAENIDRASDIASMAVPYGIYIEDYTDLEEMSLEIAHIDLIDDELVRPMSITVPGIVYALIFMTMSSNGPSILRSPVAIAVP